MIFSIIVLLKHAMGAGVRRSTLTEPRVLLGLLMGGATIYWFTGASMQAVTTGAYRAVEYIKRNIQLDPPRRRRSRTRRRSSRSARSTRRRGMFNIFIVIFCLTLAYAFFDPIFFVAYLVSIAVVGLFQAMYMANAGGAWDNAKKVVEVELHEKGTDLHAATVDRRHRRRSVQGHLVGRAEPDHQVHDAVRPARGRDGRGQPGGRRGRSASCSCWSRCSSSTARSTACASLASVARRRVPRRRPAWRLRTRLESPYQRSGHPDARGGRRVLASILLRYWITTARMDTFRPAWLNRTMYTPVGKDFCLPNVTACWPAPILPTSIVLT